MALFEVGGARVGPDFLQRLFFSFRFLCRSSEACLDLTYVGSRPSRPGSASIRLHKRPEHPLQHPVDTAFHTVCSPPGQRTSLTGLYPIPSQAVRKPPLSEMETRSFPKPARVVVRKPRGWSKELESPTFPFLQFYVVGLAHGHVPPFWALLRTRSK